MQQISPVLQAVGVSAGPVKHIQRRAVPEGGGVWLKITVHRYKPGGIGGKLLAAVRSQRGLSTGVLYMDGGSRLAGEEKLLSRTGI